jgi:hypothetical protein
MFLGIANSLTRTSINSSGLFFNSLESQQFFDRLVTPPSGSIETAYASLIDGLVAIGVWDCLDALYVIGADEATARENLRKDDHRLIRKKISGNTMSYTANTGWAKDSVSPGSQWLQNDYDFSVLSGMYQKNDAMIGLWSNASNSDAFDHALRVVNATNTHSDETHILPVYINNPSNISWSINSSSDFNSKQVARNVIRQGFWSVQRTGPTSSSLYKDGVLIDVSTSPSVDQAPIFPSWGQATLHRAFWMGSSISDNQMSSFYVLLYDYINIISGMVP